MTEEASSCWKGWWNHTGLLEDRHHPAYYTKESSIDQCPSPLLWVWLRHRVEEPSRNNRKAECSQGLWVITAMLCKLGLLSSTHRKFCPILSQFAPELIKVAPFLSKRSLNFHSCWFNPSLIFNQLLILLSPPDVSPSSKRVIKNDRFSVLTRWPRNYSVSYARGRGRTKIRNHLAGSSLLQTWFPNGITWKTRGLLEMFFTLMSQMSPRSCFFFSVPTPSHCLRQAFRWPSGPFIFLPSSHVFRAQSGRTALRLWQITSLLSLYSQHFRWPLPSKIY